MHTLEKSTFRVGDWLSGYQLIQQIGGASSASQAEVWIGSKSALSPPVTLKFAKVNRDDAVRRAVNDGLHNSWNVYMGIKRLWLAKKYSLSGVVQCLHLEQDPFMLIMEYLPGEPLKAVTTPQTWEAFYHPALRIIEILNQLHEIEIYHHDLNPGNIMMAPRGPVVVDFDAARMSGRSPLNHMGLVLPNRSLDHTYRTESGISTTMGYAAPEIILGNQPGPAADVYSLFAIFYELLTDKMLFSGKWDDVLRQHVRSAPPMLTGVPAEAVRLTNSCLEKSPNNRPVMSEVLARFASLEH